MSELLFYTSTREDGNMAVKWEPGKAEGPVLRRRQEWLQKEGIDPFTTFLMNPQHGSELIVADGSLLGRGMHEVGGEPNCDFVLVTEPDQFVFIPLADCFGVTFWNQEEETLLVAHVGAKQVDAEVVPFVLAQLEDTRGLITSKWQVTLSPAIADTSYLWCGNVKSNYTGYLASFIADNPKGICPQADEDYPFLLKWQEGFRQQLREAGIPADQIGEPGPNTFGSTRYYSHCEATTFGKPNGRHAIVAGFR